MKTCSLCRTDKDDGEFYPDKSKASGLSSRCRDCCKSATRRNYLDNRDARRAQMRAYGASPEAQTRRREIHARLKREALEAYGFKCQCCGVTDPEFLNVDHVGEWGAEHRKEIGEGTGNIYRWLKRNGYPKDRFRLLCWNCNCARGIHGYCPHERST